MANGASIIIGLVFILVLSVLAYFFSPKGENQTYVFPFPLLPPFRFICSNWALS
ncbi:MAG: hypothetical protein Q9210_002422 [Variospora velana]